MPNLRGRSELLTYRRAGIWLCQQTKQPIASIVAPVLMILSAASFTGCLSPCYLAGRTLIGEPSRYSIRVDHKRSLALYRTWAEQEWEHMAGSCAGDCSSTPDYKTGFISGFVDFVYAGGTGEPSPVPPREYWNISQRSPQGKERVSQWFAGYRHGARIARDGGYRAAGTLQLSLPESLEGDEPEWMSASRTQGETPLPHDETLPAPKPENAPTRKPSRAEKPHAATTPNSPLDNPFREDDPGTSKPAAPAAPASTAHPPQPTSQNERVNDTPIELELPTEPRELPPVKAATSLPMQKTALAKHQLSTVEDTVSTGITDASRESSRNGEALAIALAECSDESQAKPPSDGATRNEATTLVLRIHQASPTNTEHRLPASDSATADPAPTRDESRQWRSPEPGIGIRQSSAANVVIRVSGNEKQAPANQNNSL